MAEMSLGKRSMSKIHHDKYHQIQGYDYISYHFNLEGHWLEPGRPQSTIVALHTEDSHPYIRRPRGDLSTSARSVH